MFRRAWPPRRAGALAGPLALAAAALALALPAAATAAPAVSLEAKLQPARLGADTTVSIGFRIAPGPERVAAPLSEFALRLPAGMGLAATTLGLATCSASTLLAEGGSGCPHESLIGFGAAEVMVPFGIDPVRESARVAIFMARPVREHTTALFYFDGRRPVIAPLVLPSEVITPQDRLDSLLTTAVPPIPTTSDGPEATMVSLRASIGPRSLRYRKRVGKRIVSYRPRGISIPATCPPGGFVFAARFRFRDGSEAGSKAVVPCPAPAPRRGQGS
jgi:hypothetical protein